MATLNCASITQATHTFWVRCTQFMAGKVNTRKQCFIYYDFSFLFATLSGYDVSCVPPCTAVIRTANFPTASAFRVYVLAWQTRRDENKVKLVLLSYTKRQQFFFRMCAILCQSNYTHIESRVFAYIAFVPAKIWCLFYANMCARDWKLISIN